jgi:hypothetical protein
VAALRRSAAVVREIIDDVAEREAPGAAS